MPHRSLAEFLEELGRTGELARVDCDVDPQLEAAEITRRVARQQGPALLFRKLRGYDTPLVTNLLGTEARILAALEVDSIEAGQARIEQALQAGSAGDGWLDRLRLGSRTGPLSQASPHKVKSAACQQVVRLGNDVRLDELPQITVAAEEKHATLASAAIFFSDPDSHTQYAICCDVQITGPDCLTIGGWAATDDSARIYSKYAERKQPMPVAVVLGGDPTVLMAVMAPVAGADPLALAGILRTKALDAVACRTIDLLVPAESDFVIEGHIDPAQAAIHLEPCLNPAGTLTSAQAGRQMQVTAFTHRANAVMTAIVRSTEPNEASILSRTLAKLFLPATRAMLPSLVDYDLPLVAGGRYLAVASIDKHHAGQVQRLAALSLATPGLAAARILIVVDRDIDVRNFQQVLKAITVHAHPALDFVHHEGSADPGDPLLAHNALAPRLTIDATRKLVGEAGRLAAATTGSLPDEIITKVSARWAEYGLGPDAL